MRVKPEVRDYQMDAVVSCVAEFKTNSRTQCLMAPDSGKTIVSLLIKEALKPKVTIFFVPSVQLIYQQYLAWAKFRKDDFDALVVTATKLSARNEVGLNRMKINHVGVTTLASDIKTFLTAKKFKKDRVIFCTYKSSGKVIEACKRRTIDLIICDEAHHVAGRFDKQSIRLLDDKNIKVKHRLFMTATPRLCRNEDDTLISAGMNNSELFGDVAYTLSFSKAVELGILCDYRIYAAVVNKRDLSNLKVRASPSEEVALAATKKIFEKGFGTHGLSFHNKVASAHKFAAHLREVLPKQTFVTSIDYTSSNDTRNAVVESLQNADKGIISNVSIFGEGFDYDALDFIIIVDQKSSVTEIVQNIGRVIRKHKDKDVGTIVLPIYREDGEITMHETLNKSSFEQIHRVATALGEVDMMLGSEIRSRRRDGDLSQSSALFANKIKVIKEDGIEESQINDLVNKITMSALYQTKMKVIRDPSVQGAIALVEWCKKHDRLPSFKVMGTKNECDEEERRMLSVYSQTYDIARVSTEVRGMLDVVRRTWGKSGKALINWSIELAKILEYCKEHGHQPTTNQHSSWSNMLVAMTRNTVPAQVEEQLIDYINEILEFPKLVEFNKQLTAERVNKVVLWMRKHKRRPSKKDVTDGVIAKKMYDSYSMRNRTRSAGPIIDEAEKWPAVTRGNSRR